MYISVILEIWKIDVESLEISSMIMLQIVLNLYPLYFIF